MNDEVKNNVESEAVNFDTEVDDTAVDQMISDVASNPNADNNLKSEQLINNKEKSGVTICIPIENFDENTTIKDVMSNIKNNNLRIADDEVRNLINGINEDKSYEVLSNSDWINKKEEGVKINVLNPNGEVYYRDTFKVISIFFKKPTFNQSNGSFFDIFDTSHVSIPQSNINTLSDQSIMIELSDKFDSNNPSNLSKVKSIKIFDKNIKLENASATLDGFNSVEIGNAGLPRGFFDTIVPIDGGDWNHQIPVYNPTLNVRYKKLIGSPIFKFIKINQSLPMKITIPAFGSSKEQIIVVNKDDNFSCTLSESSFKAIDSNKVIPNNLLVKMPREFYSVVKDDPKTFETALKNKIVNGGQCVVNFIYKDINNKSQNIEFIFKTKDSSSMTSDSWSNEIKSLFFNQSFSRKSTIYLESVKNLNYFVKFDKDGRALYNAETNTLDLAKIAEYKNPESKLLSETNLIQSFYEYQTAPQTYNFGKKIFWYLNDCPIILVNKRDKKVILVLNVNDRIDIYFNDIEELTGATSMWLIDKSGKRKIEFENCNISINLPLSIKPEESKIFYNTKLIPGKTTLSSLGNIISSTKDKIEYTLTSVGEVIKNNFWKFDNRDGFHGNAQYERSGSSGNYDIVPENYAGYQYVQYIENVSIASIEFDAIDINKNVTVTLPSYTTNNAHFTKIDLDHGGFVISNFNLNKVEFDIKFNSKDLYTPNTKTNVVDQNDFVNEELMTKLIAEQQQMSKISKEEYQYVNVIHYNPNIDLDGKIRKALFEQNIRSFTLVFLITGLISVAITLTQKILKALGVKISKELELALNIIQVGLSLGTLVGGVGSGYITFSIEKFSEIDKIIKSITTLSKVLSDSITNITVMIDYPNVINNTPLVEITDNTMIRWRDGIKNYLPCTEDVANIIIIHVYTFASIGDVEKFRKLVGQDKVEYTTLLCLQGILKYGAEYIYKIGNGNISIGEAETLNYIFIKKASLTYLEGLINIYQG